MENELKKDIDLVLYENQNVVVSTKEEFLQAGDILKLIKNKIKFLEDKRKEYTSDLVKQKKRIDDDFKEMQEPLKELVNVINGKMVSWNVAEQKRLDEEQKKIEAEALKRLEEEGESEVEVPVVNEGLKSNKGNIATSTMKEVYNWKVADETRIPREYLMVNEVKIGKAVRDSKGTIKIDGIQNITTNKINSR